MNRVFKVPDFDKYATKILTKKELNELEKFIDNSKKTSDIGKPLSYNFLKEKKIGNK